MVCCRKYKIGGPKFSLFSSVQLLSCVRLFVTQWTSASQASLSITNCRSPPTHPFASELGWKKIFFFCFSSVPQSCPTPCDPMDCSMSGLPVRHQLPEFIETHVHWVGDAIQPTISSSIIPFSSRLQSFSASGSFPRNQFFTSGGQSIGGSASTSVLPMNIQDWFPLGWTGWISLQSKGLSRVFSNTTVQKHQFFILSFLHSPTLTPIHDYWKNHSFD